jgi:isopenicillin N synthase-like dioxygenase
MGAQGKLVQTTKANGSMPLQPDELVINVGDMLSRHTKQ